MSAPLPARLIHVIGTRTWLRRYSKHPREEMCPGKSGYSYHNALVHVADDSRVPTGHLHEPGGKGDYVDDPRWPTQCDHCDYVFTEDDHYQQFMKLLWNTASGQPEPGDVYVAHWQHNHLYALCPDGCPWDIDGTASNGTRDLPGWVRSGEPPLITVTPSILTPNYHGYLQHGIWTPDLEGRTY